MMVCIDTPPHLAMPDQPWMQKCWVICSWCGSARSCGEVELDRVVDQAVDPQPVVGEARRRAARCTRRSRGTAPLCQKYGEMSFSVYWPGLASRCSNSRCAGPISA